MPEMPGMPYMEYEDNAVLENGIYKMKINFLWVELGNII